MKNAFKLSGIIILCLSILLINSCKKKNPTPPVVTTSAVSAITQTTAICGGDVTSEGTDTVLVRGVCWNTTVNPVINDSHTTDGLSTGSFVSNITGLSAYTAYHVRAYATNSAGTGYGNDLSFTTTAVTVPILTTAAISSIDVTTAVSGGTITSNGGATITVSGICWATTPTPLATGSHTTDGTTSGSFSSNLTLLTGGTPYYVRAYATNSIGTAYGNQLIFNTKLADVDGNKYNIVVIGTQIWMAENLKTTKFNDNTTLIPNVTDNTAWTLLNTPAYSWYNNDGTTYKPLYGAIYNWFTIDAASNGGKNVCPTGWHAPSDVEFQTLELDLGMTAGTAIGQVGAWGYRGTDQGSEMKNTTGWATGENGTNISGFSALPGGYRYGESGVFNSIGDLSYWWSTTAVDATTAYYRELEGILPDVPTNNQVFRGGVLYQAGKYVRCVKD